MRDEESREGTTVLDAPAARGAARTARRRLPVGAEVQPGGGVHFRVWAPKRRQVEVVFEGHGAPRALALEPEDGGYFSGLVTQAGAGALYRFRLDGGEGFPDPASRFQPEGPHGPSQVVDPSAFSWQDAGWRGVDVRDGRDCRDRRGQILYEMHVGTFTPEGTWAAAAGELEELAGLGITLIEMMPVADFAGSFGWGYDGVDLYAPTRLYGEPDDLRRFVDRAHALGLAVILDVVYNHLGPSGNYLKQFSDRYFTREHETDWGEAIDFDGEGSGPVREFFLANAGFWIGEYHFDGLRLDATQDIHDGSADHLIAAIARRAREAARAGDTGAGGAAGGFRAVYLVAENEPQEARLVRDPGSGGYGLDAIWNDDFHHSALVAMTGRNEAYYSDYSGTPQELISAIKRGFLYQGQLYSWQGERRGEPTRGLPRQAFVHFIQNHDQVSNSARGERVHFLTGPGRYRAMTALLLLGPQTPMLFQGQEFCASAPFVYFADHEPELARAVRDGRAEFLAQFPSLATPEIQAGIPDPGARETFERCKLDPAERGRHAPAYALHRDLLLLRREEAAFREPEDVDGAVLGSEALVLRFFGAEPRQDRLLILNLGNDMQLQCAPEPLLAPPEGCHWVTLWSSEDPRYGGTGAPEPETVQGWRLAGRAALVLRPEAGRWLRPGEERRGG